MNERKPYPSDISDDEWAFVAPYLTLMREDAPQREYPLAVTLKRWFGPNRRTIGENLALAWYDGFQCFR